MIRLRNAEFGVRDVSLQHPIRTPNSELRTNMNYTEFIRIAWDSIVSNKLRSSLTLLGIVIGVFAIIVSVTAVKVIDAYFQDTIQFIGSNTFTVSKWPGVQFGRPDESIRNRKNITYEQALTLKRRVRLAASVSPTDDFANGVKARYGAYETDQNISLLGVDENWLLNAGFEMGEGRFLTEQDVQYVRPVAVIGQTVAEALFPNETPLGKDIRVDRGRFQVIGVLAEKGSAFGQDQDALVVAPIPYCFNLYGQSDRNLRIDVMAPSVELLSATMDEVIGQMRAIRKVEPGKDNDFEIITNEALVESFTAFTGVLTMGGALIGLISLLAAGIGIMNIMLVSVTERTREIGIRKSVGAKRGAVLRQFLLEAIFICQIGGLIGVALGVVAGNAAMVALFDISPAVPWAWVIGGVLAVTVIAVTFGVYPAYKAAGLDPIEALRYE